jgi:hypothetical protein
VTANPGLPYLFDKAPRHQVYIFELHSVFPSEFVLHRSNSFIPASCCFLRLQLNPCALETSSNISCLFYWWAWIIFWWFTGDALHVSDVLTMSIQISHKYFYNFTNVGRTWFYGFVSKYVVYMKELCLTLSIPDLSLFIRPMYDIHNMCIQWNADLQVPSQQCNNNKK